MLMAQALPPALVPFVATEGRYASCKHLVRSKSSVAALMPGTSCKQP